MTRLRTLSTSVAWTAWSAASFARAASERKPVLLSIAAEWCASCQDMDRGSYGNPSIATTINELFVPIRVDADRQPDIAERYGLGGWPTTAFLDADGLLLGGGTYVSPDRMPVVLEQVLSAFASRVQQPAGRGVSPSASPVLAGATAADDLVRIAFASFDPEHGGFGVAPKFPLHPPLRLALALWTESRDPALENMLVTSLDAMGWGPLFDDEHGGFFHYAEGRDWSGVHSEKLLEPNAALLRLYLDAGATMQVARFSDRAADILRYVQTWLADAVDGGWYGSQGARALAEHASSAPPVAGVMYADSNAAMVSTALHAASAAGDDGLRDFALESLERVLLSCYKPGDGVAHFHNHGRQSCGLLADQVAMARACLDAHGVTGNVVYEMMAEELMHFALRTMWNEERGGFFDRAAGGDDIGLMRTRLVPFAANCEAAHVLRALAAASGDNDFRSAADLTLAAIAPDAEAQGPLAALYLLALRDAPLR